VLVALGVAQHPVIVSVIGFLSLTVAPVVLMTTVANAGRRAEKRLYQIWGGKPTALLIRAKSSDDASASQRATWRAALERVTSITLHTPAQELADPVGADEVIETAVGLVRHLSHDGEHPEIARENAHYGFERNTWGIRWVGRGMAVLGVCVIGVAQYAGWSRPDAMWIGMVVNSGLLLAWVFLPSKARVRAAAMRYGKQLFNALARENTGPRTQT
jgi:hypothetical protein